MGITIRFSAIAAWIIQVILLISVQAQEKQKVPEDFSYPPSPQIIQINKAMRSNSLSGVITDPSGSATSEVLVEILESNWGNRIEAILTDSEGVFAFTKNAPGVYFLRLSKPGFDSMLLKVQVAKKKAGLRLRVKLRLST
jgi:hypothetical protein